MGDIDCTEQLSRLFWQDQRHRQSAFADERVYSSEGPELRGTRHPVLNLAVRTRVYELKTEWKMFRE